MTVVLDAGALLAAERGDRDMWVVLEDERRAGRVPVTHAGVVGQVWRGGSGRQTRLARALAGVEIRSMDDDLGRRAGVLLGRARQADVIDAALILLADDGDEVFTSDPADLRVLARATGVHIDLIPI